MSSPNISSFTVGHWRHAVRSFEVLYPKDKFDWDEPAVIVADVLDDPHSSARSTSVARQLLITHAPLDFAFEEQRVTALNAIRVVHTDRSRVACVATFLSRSVHQSIAEEFDDKAFMDDARDYGAVALDLDLPGVSPFKEAPANTPVVDIFKEMGVNDVDAEKMVQATRRAAEVITALTGEYIDIPKLFPEI